MALPAQLQVEWVAGLARVLSEHLAAGVMSLLVGAVVTLFRLQERGQRQRALRAEAEVKELKAEVKVEREAKEKYALRSTLLLERMAPYAPALQLLQTQLVREGLLAKPKRTRATGPHATLEAPSEGEEKAE